MHDIWYLDRRNEEEEGGSQAHDGGALCSRI